MADTIMVAYSFDKDNPLQVPAELKAILELVRKTPCNIEPLENATQNQLEERLALLGKKILIFHFAGHAGGAAIELNDGFTEDMSLTDMEVFSKIMADDARSLRLVFLNGCSTADQSRFLRNEGVPVVISTTLPLDDNYAYAFAKKFYETFFNASTGFTVQESFDRTLRSFNSKVDCQFFLNGGKAVNDNLVHPAKRGAFMLTPEMPKEIYRIDGEPEVLAQTFADWHGETPAQPASHFTDLEKSQPVSGGVSKEDAYLLCNRKKQKELLREILSKKATGALPSPNFIFVNGHNNDSIPDLLKRLQKFIIPGIRTDIDGRIEHLEFPDVDFFDIPGDEKKPLLNLGEIYREQLLNKEGQKFNDDTLFVICHKVFKPVWKDGIENLFRYYLGEFSDSMRQKIGERVVVLFFLVHTGKPEQIQTLQYFTAMYQRLKADAQFSDRVAYFEKLPLIEESDLLEWHDTVFQEAMEVDENLPDMYFLEAKKFMEKVIKERINRNG